MNTFRALLLDFERRPHLGNQLREIFAGSAAPRVDLEFQPVEEHNLKIFAETWPDRLGALTVGLTLLVFDRLPEAQEIGLLLEELRGRRHGVPSVVITPMESSTGAMDLLNQGAVDVWLAPLRPVEVLTRARHWFGYRPQEKEEAVRALGLEAKLGEFIGESPALISAIREIPFVASYDVCVLIRGETGTGKEVCARALHYLSSRSDQPFVAINCGALPVELIENELCGHEAGAFTGANGAASGLIERANHGTLFLDEVDALPLSAQVKLLRFLQDKHYRRLGSTKDQLADVRVVAATNADLVALMHQGRFRQDLFYRLSVVGIDLPPLRERGDDIVLLARHFLKRYAAQFKKAVHGFMQGALRKLRLHTWPGNVRELDNVITRAVLLSHESLIHPDAIVLPTTVPAGEGSKLRTLKGADSAGEEMTFRQAKTQTVAIFERQYLEDKLRSNQENISAAARAARVGRREFVRLLRKHNLSTRSFESSSSSR